MSFAAAFFSPLMFLFPVAGLIDAELAARGEPAPQAGDPVVAEGDPPAAWLAARPQLPQPEPDAVLAWPFGLTADSFRVASADQVRIEQRMTIRITPFPAPTRPDLPMDLPQRESRPRFVERKMGKCLPVAGITGVQTDGPNRLILFMRDQRIVSAELERACRARDFYSGFYLAHTPDGQLCVDRDTLLSRSGANCKLTRMHELVAVGD